MTRPGTRLRAIAARLFDAQTMERYVDPAVTDLQTEYEETAKRGRRRERARVFVAWSHPRVADFAVCLIPQALPLSIPVGLTFGVLWALGRLSASRTALMLVLVLALGASLVSFVTLAWVMPNANQAFRTATAGFPVTKGNNELTIGELRERTNNPSHYHLHLPQPGRRTP